MAKKKVDLTKFIDNYDGGCLFCDNDDVEVVETNFSESGMTETLKCNSCNETWGVEYMRHSITHKGVVYRKNEGDKCQD